MHWSSDTVHSVCVTPDGKIISGSSDTTVRAWNVIIRLRRIRSLHKAWPYRFRSFSMRAGDGRIVSGSRDGSVRLWDKDGNKLAVYKEDCWGSVSDYVWHAMETLL